MNSEGHIFKIDDEQEAVKRAKEEITLLTERDAKILQRFEPEHRHEIYRDMKSKNHNAKRRARKKIAKASRQRNRN